MSAHRPLSAHSVKKPTNQHGLLPAANQGGWTPLTLRYTGQNPPADILARYPNWEWALDEEDVPGQDETTWKPADVQTRITEDTVATAADAWFPGGQSHPALVSLNALDVTGVCVYEPPQDWYIDCRAGRWIEPPQWLFETADLRFVRLTDGYRFPLRIATRLPYGRTGKPLKIEITPDGNATEW